MSFNLNALGEQLQDVSITLMVSTKEPLIQLANLIDWQRVAHIAEADLQKTKKRLWWLGRKLNLRSHLAVMILQVLLKTTDRGIETQIRRSPIYQVFCGNSIVVNWHCQDHTRIEKFRNRLTPATHKAIGDYVLKLAVQVGFANPSMVDIDSTVQEANMSYPSDASLMRKLAQKCAKVINFMRNVKATYLPEQIKIDLKMLEKKGKEYFFLAKNTLLEKRRRIFKEYHAAVVKEVLPILEFCEQLNLSSVTHLPWYIKQTLAQITMHARQYLTDVAHFIETNAIKKGKILAFHCFMVSCIKKGKVGKDKEFGRVFQMGRIGGNFMTVYSSTSVRMEDKKSLLSIVKEHEEIFGKGLLKNIATDKGYYSASNVREITALGILTDGMQRPRSIKNAPSGENVDHLHNRRAGVEPLIGHVKGFGLQKSKMKSDTAMLSQGYRSVMGFNLHQLQRKLAKVG